MCATGRLLRDLPIAEDEVFETLVQKGAVRIERITSKGHSSPPGFWYDQDEDEWVMVMAGRATLVIEGRDQPVVLRPGDWLELPAHTRHRIVETDADEATVWLAIFYPAKER
ncbi:MAG: cupin domain-containing protein [Acidobacteriota bacterium]